MQHSLLIDNWTLQNLGELLCYGLDGESADDLVFTEGGKNFRFEKAPAGPARGLLKIF
jgi:hypothetical protein